MVRDGERYRLPCKKIEITTDKETYRERERDIAKKRQACKEGHTVTNDSNRRRRKGLCMGRVRLRYKVSQIDRQTARHISSSKERHWNKHRY